MSVTNLLSAALLSTTAATGSARASIMVNPPYSGPMSTFQCWDFFTPDPIAPADPGFDNHFGNPTIHVGGGSTWLPSQNGKDGVYCLRPPGSGAVNDFIDFQIPNMRDDTQKKLIWVEIKYFGNGGIGTPPNLTGQSTAVPTETVTWNSRTTRDAGPNHPDWFIDTWTGTLDHCPAMEVLTVQPRIGVTTNTYIDYVCINTICVPTPGSGALVAASAMVFGVRRRRD